MGYLGGFLRTMFGLEKKYRIRRVKVVVEAGSDEAKPEPPDETEPEKLRRRIIVMVTWLMAIVFCISLVAIVGFPLLGIDLPQVLPQILFAILGYFGGAFAAFMRFSTS